jgi:hypothetical protein
MRSRGRARPPARSRRAHARNCPATRGMRGVARPEKPQTFPISEESWGAGGRTRRCTTLAPVLWERAASRTSRALRAKARVRRFHARGDEVAQRQRSTARDLSSCSRVGGTCERGGVCVSEPGYQMVRSRAHVSARSLGPQTLNSVAAPVSVYALSATDLGEPARRRPGLGSARASEDLWPSHRSADQLCGDPRWRAHRLRHDGGRSAPGLRARLGHPPERGPGEPDLEPAALPGHSEGRTPSTLP